MYFPQTFVSVKLGFKLCVSATLSLYLDGTKVSHLNRSLDLIQGL